VTEHSLARFESLGDNCEFGIAQRFVGLEPLGLLRLAFTPLACLLDGLDSRFAGLDDPCDLQIDRDPNDEIMMISRRYHLRYHTNIIGRPDEAAAIRDAQWRNALFLRRRLLEDLAIGHKTMVRKAEGAQTIADAQRLLESLRAHGPNTLLWVSVADERHPPGSVEVVEPHLLHGRISRFASFDRVPHLCLTDWLEICEGAHLLRLIAAAPGEQRRPGPRHVPGNILPESARMPLPWWQPGPAIEASLHPSMAAPVAGAGVMTVRTLEPCALRAVFNRFVPEGLASGSLYVASMWVFVPAAFEGSLVGAVFDGFASLRVENADLTLRDQWQRVFVLARVPDGLSVANPALILSAPAGSVIHMSCWKLELGVIPTAWHDTAGEAG
jgi:hypothetical protein